MKLAYAAKTIRGDRAAIVRQAQLIVDEYLAQGYSLTLRQLYYQFVARDLLPNEQRHYKRLGQIITDARMGGHLDWLAIEDRTRNVRARPHWNDPAEFLRTAANGYSIDLRSDQPIMPEVWVEKDALIGVLDRACRPLDVPYFSCRGYVSASEMWAAGQRIIDRALRGRWVDGSEEDGPGYALGQRTVILHLGDHDPSGVQMTEDIESRLDTFYSYDAARAVDEGLADGDELQRLWPEVRRIALTPAQIAEHQPPPNPAKLSDSRARAYIRRHGHESWELDALPPDVLAQLITDEVGQLTRTTTFMARRRRQDAERRRLVAAAERMTEQEG